MPDFVYTNGVPNPPNNPSADVGNMQTNNNSISGLIAVDHVGFNGTLGVGGKHNQVQIQNQGSIPSSLTSGQGTLYCKNVGGAQLFFTPGTSGNEYQLTRVNTTNFSTFGNTTGAQNSGWTFLPGGLLLQYGTRSIAAKGTVTTISFPFAFTSAVFSITIGSYNSANNSPTNEMCFIKDGTVALGQFQMTNSSSGTLDNVSWMAIGI